MTIEDNLIARLGKKTAENLIKVIDDYFWKVLKQHSSFLYWILSKKLFWHNWTVKLLGINFNEYHLSTIRNYNVLDYILEITIRGKVIGRAEIKVSKKGKVKIKRSI